MNRGDRRKPIFRDDLDHKKFLTTLAEVCTKTDWQIHGKRHWQHLLTEE